MEHAGEVGGFGAGNSETWGRDMNPALSEELVLVMLHAQSSQRPQPRYLLDVQRGLIEPWMREMVVQFMNELGEDFGMRNDTVGLAMCYFDRFLSAVPVDKAEVQLVAVACVLVAAKFGERRMPALADLEFVCQGKYNADDIRRAECDVIKKLNWQLHAVTPHMFCAHFLRAAVHQPARAAIVFRHAEFFVDLSFYVYDALEYSPCVVGAAALLCSQQQIAHRLTEHGRPAGSFAPEEIELATCAELSAANIAQLCALDEAELVTCQRLLYDYFVKHFLHTAPGAPSASPLSPSAHTAQRDAEMGAPPSPSSPPSPSEREEGDSHEVEAASELLESARARDDTSAGRKPFGGAEDARARNQPTPDSVDEIVAKSFAPIGTGATAHRAQ